MPIPTTFLSEAEGHRFLEEIAAKPDTTASREAYAVMVAWHGDEKAEAMAAKLGVLEGETVAWEAAEILLDALADELGQRVRQ